MLLANLSADVGLFDLSPSIASQGLPMVSLSKEREDFAKDFFQAMVIILFSMSLSCQCACPS